METPSWSSALDGKDTVGIMFCFDDVMSGARCVEMWKEVLEKSYSLGYTISNVNNSDMFSLDGKEIHNPRRNKGVITFTKMKV